jgi:hypothetical protein
VSSGGTAIPRLQDLTYFEVTMAELRQRSTFEQIRQALVDRARDNDQEADLDGSFDEAKWERRRNDPTEHVNNAVDVLKEAMRLGWVKRCVLPSTPGSAYLHTTDIYEVLPPGREWADLATNDRRAAYNALAGVLIGAHPQVGGFLKAVGARPDSESSSFTVPLLRWDPARHSSEDAYLADLLRGVAAAADAGKLGWAADEATIDNGIRGYVERIRARRLARGKTQTRKEFLKTCEEAITKVAFAAVGTRLDYISMELLRRWGRFLGVANFSYYAPGPYALRLWATGTVMGSGTDVTITRSIGPEVRRQALDALLAVWQERRASASAAMYAPVWELRAAVCWRLRIADAEWDKAINEILLGTHEDLPYRVHLDQASLGPIPASTRPLVLPSSSGHRRIFNVMTIIPTKENR